MSAVEHSFIEPAPERLYVDTDILVNHLVATQPHFARCRAFLERLARDGRTTLYVSSLAWVQFAHVVSRERVRLALPEEVQRRYRLDRWQRAEVRRRYVDDMLQRLDDLLGQFPIVEVSLTPTIRQIATAYMADLGLGSQDAIHPASAAYEEVVDFASFDEVYRRVDDLELWNDRIHGTRGTQAGPAR